MTQPGFTGAQTQALQENADRLGLVWKKRPATIVSPESDDPTGVTAVMDGDTVAINVYSLVGFLPVGARVMCDIVPPSGIYVVGYIGAPITAPVSNIQISRFSPTFPTSSTTYVVITGTTVPFTKRYAASRLAVSIEASGFTSSAPPFLASVGIRVNSVDFDVARLLYNVANTHLSFGGSTYAGVAGAFPAGALTIDLVAKVDNGAKTFSIDANDLISVTITEVL